MSTADSPTQTGKKYLNKLYAAAAAGAVGITMVMVTAVGTAAAQPYNNSWNNNYYGNNSYRWICYGNGYNNYNNYNNYNGYSMYRRVYNPYMNCYIVIGYNNHHNRWEYCNNGMPYYWNNNYNNYNGYNNGGYNY